MYFILLAMAQYTNVGNFFTVLRSLPAGRCSINKKLVESYPMLCRDLLNLRPIIRNAL